VEVIPRVETDRRPARPIRHAIDGRDPLSRGRGRYRGRATHREAFIPLLPARARHQARRAVSATSSSMSLGSGDGAHHRRLGQSKRMGPWAERSSSFFFFFFFFFFFLVLTRSHNPVRTRRAHGPQRRGRVCEAGTGESICVFRLPAGAREKVTNLVGHARYQLDTDPHRRAREDQTPGRFSERWDDRIGSRLEQVLQAFFSRPFLEFPGTPFGPRRDVARHLAGRGGDDLTHGGANQGGARPASSWGAEGRLKSWLSSREASSANVTGG